MADGGKPGRRDRIESRRKDEKGGGEATMVAVTPPLCLLLQTMEREGPEVQSVRQVWAFDGCLPSAKATRCEGSRGIGHSVANCLSVQGDGITAL